MVLASWCGGRAVPRSCAQPEGTIEDSAAPAGGASLAAGEGERGAQLAAVAGKG